MKAIVLLIGLGLLAFIGGSGCESEHGHHHEYRGGAYDRDYRGYGHDEYRPYDGRYYDHTYDHHYDQR